MNASIEFVLNKAYMEQIAEHLLHCDADFMPPLSGRVEIIDYAKKIASYATRFEAWSGGTLVGLVAAYCNDQKKHIVYITSVSVLKAWTGKGIAAYLIGRCIEHAKAVGMRQVSLKVASDNTVAIRLYEQSGFVAGKAHEPFATMDLYLNSEGERGQQA
jgi:ribosomal protein S18 acetylase RimI-like enzyme